MHTVSMPRRVTRPSIIGAAWAAMLFIPIVSESAGNDVAAFPPDTPSSYRVECGRCHTAFPPGMLAGDDWQSLMSDMARHFGEAVLLPQPVSSEIAGFLQRNAGDSRRFDSRSEPPRVSTSTWFRRTHGAIRTHFGDPGIESAANCGACHERAAAGNYDRDSLRIPQRKE